MDKREEILKKLDEVIIKIGLENTIEIVRNRLHEMKVLGISKDEDFIKIYEEFIEIHKNKIKDLH